MNHAGTLYHGAYIIFGLLISLFLYLTLRELHFKRVPALLISLVFSLSPAAVSYENWLFYTYPVAAMVTALGYFSIRMVKTRCLISSGLFLGLSALLVLTRSLFHPVFYVLALLLALAFMSGKRSKVLVQGGLIFLPVLALLLKNLLVFGFFGTSSWYGLNLAKPTTFMLSDREREVMVERGILSEHALVHPFGELWRRTEWLESTDIPTFGTAATDSLEKSSGVNNYNNGAYLLLSEAYYDDALTVIRTSPGTFIKAMVHAYGHFFVPASCYALVEQNVAQMGVYGRFYELVFQGSPVMITRLELALAEGNGDWALVILSLNLFMLVLLPLGLLYLVAGLIRRKVPQYFVPLIIILVFVTVVGNTVEVGENNRFRFMIDPLIVTIIVSAIALAWKTADSLLLDPCV